MPGCKAFKTAIITIPITYSTDIVIAQTIICLNGITPNSEKAFLFFITSKRLYDWYKAKKNGIAEKYNPIRTGYFKNANSGYILAVYPASEGNAKIHKPKITMAIIHTADFKKVIVPRFIRHLIHFVYNHIITKFIDNQYIFTDYHCFLFKHKRTFTHKREKSTKNSPTILSLLSPLLRLFNKEFNKKGG
jgi:hypothetical protein